MAAFIRGTAVLIGLLIVANIVGLLTRPDTVPVPTFDAETRETARQYVRVDADDTDPVLWDQLRSLGYAGFQGDGCECLYVPEWTVIDVPDGTWTMTPDTGLRRCEDGATGECTGREFLPGS